jgi:ketosteroid isomerase-like protein
VGAVDLDGFRAWLEGYERAWRAYDAQAAGELFAEDALYHTSPFREPWRGRAEIMAKWTRDEDDTGGFDFEFEPIAVMGDIGVARCRVVYRAGDGSVAQDFSDIWVVRFDADDRAREFAEWFMLRGPGTV